jgi:hypothetical protein
LDTQRLCGDYAFYDDGWQATLSLRAGNDGRVGARYFAHDRTRGEFTATAEIEGQHLQLTVRDFNELPEQVYSGYFFRRGRVAIAGTTAWKGRPFGFFAWRQPPCSLGPLRPENVVAEDFLGVYGLYCDDRHATLALSSISDGLLLGSLREDGADHSFPVEAVVSTSVSHQIEVTVRKVPGDEVPSMTLMMFPQRRTAMAGWLDWAGLRLGCFALRYSGPNHGQ